jgi:hypothetical protein
MKTKETDTDRRSVESESSKEDEEETQEKVVGIVLGQGEGEKKSSTTAEARAKRGEPTVHKVFVDGHFRTPWCCLLLGFTVKVSDQYHTSLRTMPIECVVLSFLVPICDY